MSMTSNVLHDRSTGAAAAAVALTALGEIEILSVRYHADGASAAENLTVEIDSAVATAYDVVLVTKAMNGLTDYVWYPSHPVPVAKGEVVDVNYANSNGDNWGIEIAYRKLY